MCNKYREKHALKASKRLYCGINATKLLTLGYFFIFASACLTCSSVGFGSFFASMMRL